MAVIGAHMLLYTPEPGALRAVLPDVFGCQVPLYEPRHPLAIETGGSPR